MIDLPVVVKVLKHLRDNRDIRSTVEEIMEGVEAPSEYVDRALERLMEKGIVLQENGHYFYKATPWAEDISQKMLALYERIRQKPSKELLIRGAIASRSAINVEALLRVLEEEGISREETTAFIENDAQKGYLKQMRMVYLKVEPFVIPLVKYLSPGGGERKRFARMREDYEKAGLELLEEVYLMESYPPELARPAREYLKREWPEVQDKILIQEMPLRFPQML